MKKILASLMVVMLLVGFVPTTTVEASEVAVSEIVALEIENLTEINDRSDWTVTITENNVNLRIGPGTNFISLGQVHRGDQGTRLAWGWGTDGYVWHQIRMTSGQNAGRTGFVRDDFVSFG